MGLTTAIALTVQSLIVLGVIVALFWGFRDEIFASND
jgi:hypothetical protein